MKPNLERWLWPQGPRADIWALVDAAQDQRVYWSITDSYLNHSCLFAGPLPKEIAMVAPYLVQLEPGDKFTKFLSNEWGKGACVYLECDESMRVLRHHLRKFLTVQDRSGRRLLFRYYDPYVLRAFLPPCNTDELKAIFGPVRSYWAESDDPNTMLQFQFDGRALKVSEREVLGGGLGGGEPLSFEMGPGMVIVQKYLTLATDGQRRRVPIILNGGGGLESSGGTFKRSSPGVRLFRSATSEAEIPFRNNVWKIPVGSFTPDLTIYAEGVSPDEVTLTLDMGHGAVVSGIITVVVQRE